jgi:thiamine biosynthesis protein ThiS
VHIVVNGKNRDILSPMTITGLLEALGANPKAVVVERNLRIVDRMAFDVEELEEGDRIEIIRLVGGG